MRLDRGPEPLAKRVCRAARAPSQEKRRPPEGAPTAEEAHRMHAGNPLFPRSSKRHAAPRARAGGHAARSSDCGGEAGGGLGGNGERRWRGRCDVDHLLRAARAPSSGEERLVPTSSRILFHLSRLMAAVPAANLVGWRARLAVGRVGRWRGRRDVDRCLPAVRALVGGEERLVPTSSRILFHLSRLMVAVPAANLARCGCRAGQRLAVGRVLGAEECAATSTAAFSLRGRARAARSGLYRPPPG